MIIQCGRRFGIVGQADDRLLGERRMPCSGSEDYGHTYARAMGCVHVQVDRARERVPCSGSAIRRDPFGHWEFLEPPVCGWFVKRVCVLGAESTGTTTLAEALAARLGTVWVPEYGREYSERKQQRGETEWWSEEFVKIATEQNRREDAAAREANRILVCDTNSFATRLWHRRYVGSESEAVAEVAARANRCDLYLLTGDEIPFVQDGLRDGEHIRHEMHRWFVTALEGQAVPWQLVSGSRGDRVEAGMAAIRGLWARCGRSHSETQRRKDVIISAGKMT